MWCDQLLQAPDAFDSPTMMDWLYSQNVSQNKQTLFKKKKNHYIEENK